MNDSPPSTPLTDQALARLRKLADGNGLSPAAVELVGTEEKTYEMEGTLSLTPKVEVQNGRYQGGPQGRNRQTVANVAALRSEVGRRQQQFLKGRDWIETALGELKAAEGHGWGLDGAHVTMPDRTVILAATEPCPVCHGQKLVTCPQCRGQGLIMCLQCQGHRRERCYTCGGTGTNPQHPNQPCITCQGTRLVLCRRCQGRGQLTCPTCHGQRGTPCPNCKGTGQLTEEAALTFSAETHFKLNSQGLPSGLRRGLDRLGVANLAKGHADIEIVKPKEEEPPPKLADGEKPADTTPPELRYIAKLPYADIKLRFGSSRVAIISAFGKRAALLGVPTFLDDALQPARTLLRRAATDSSAFEGALKPRAVREALEIELGGGGLKEFRRLYPIGLSQETAKEILAGLRQAMKAFTLRMRTIAAVASGAASAGIFALVFLTDLHTSLTRNIPVAVVFVLDIVLLAAVLGLDILALGAASRFTLRRRFPEMKIALRQRTGRTGYSLLAAVTAIYVVVLFLAPLKPVWLLRFFQ